VSKKKKYSRKRAWTTLPLCRLPQEDPLLAAFKEAAAEGAVLELRLRLLCGVLPELEPHSHALRLQDTEAAIAAWFTARGRMNSDDAKKLELCRQLRKKLLHCNFPMALKKLDQLNEVDGSGGGRAELTAASIRDWLRHLAANGDLASAANVFIDAAELVYALTEQISAILREEENQKYPATTTASTNEKVTDPSATPSRRTGAPSQVFMDEFKRAAAEAAVVELRLHLLVALIPELHACGDEMNHAESAIIGWFSAPGRKPLSRKEVRTLLRCRELRNKILHCDFRNARVKLHESGARRRRGNVTRFDLRGQSVQQQLETLFSRSGGTLVADAASTRAVGIYGWLLELGSAGDFEEAVIVFGRAADLVNRTVLQVEPILRRAKPNQGATAPA